MANELGSFIGPTYYSSLRAKNSEGPLVEWNEKDSQLFMRADHKDATNVDLINAQKRLHELWYLEPVLVDSTHGKFTKGAIHRWRSNTTDGPKRWWYDIEDVDIHKMSEEDKSKSYQ